MCCFFTVRSAKSETLLDPVTGAEASGAKAEQDKHKTPHDPTTRFKSQTLPRNTKYYCDSGRCFASDTMTLVSCAVVLCPFSAV